MKLALLAALLSAAFGASGFVEFTLNARSTPYILDIQGPGVPSYNGAFANGKVTADTPLSTHASIDRAKTPVDRLRVSVAIHSLDGGTRTEGLRPISCLDGSSGLVCSAQLSAEPLPVDTILHYNWQYRSEDGQLRPLGHVYGLIITPGQTH